MQKSEDCPKKTANETTENKQTSKLPKTKSNLTQIAKGKMQNAKCKSKMSPKQREKGKGVKNNIKKARKRLLC